MHPPRRTPICILRLARACGATVAMLATASPVFAQVASLSKGQQILVSRGMQINGIIALTSDPFHLSTLQSTNFTAPFWAWTSDVSKLGAASAGAPWAKWFDYNTENDLTAAESPYRSNLVQLYVGDEQNLNDATIFNNTVNWFNANRPKFPTTMLLTNQWGTEVAESTMINFVAQANPDAVNFDNYPYVVGSGSYVAEEYGDLSKYRRLGLGSYIGASGNAPRPYGVVIQTYQTTGDNRRAPSDSEMRRDLFAAWTAGYTFASTFTYNSGATTLFTNGDTNITTLGTQFKETAAQSRNLGPTLIKLISKGAATRFIAGQDSAGTVHDVPSGWSPWAAGAEGDPYTSSVAVANTGTKNSGHPGDVLIGYFSPMLDSYDGPAYTNEQYFMVTNGLADPTGIVADCKQEVTLDFEFIASGMNSLQRLRRSDGQVETVPLTPISGNHYRLTLSLDGGTGDLFKFNDGAPFVGTAAPALVYWDSDSSATNNNSTTGAGTGGNGNWNGSSSTWYNGSSNSAWSAGKHAIFWGTAGIVTLATPQSANSLAFLTNGYTLTGSTLTMTGAAIMADTGVTANIGSSIAGTLGIIKNGSGTVNFTAGNTYAGGTTINGGVLAIASPSSLGTVPATPAVNIAINNGAMLRFNGSGMAFDVNRQVHLGTGGGTIDTNGNDAAIAGRISGTSLTKSGGGILALSGMNTFSSGTMISGGALQVSSDANLGAPPATLATNITLDGGTLRFGGIFDLSNTRGISIGPGGGTIDTNGFGNDFGYSPTNGFRGGDLTKTGDGTFYASATTGGSNNLWTGRLILKQGTWKIQASDGLPINPNLDGNYYEKQVTFNGGKLEVQVNNPTLQISAPKRGMYIQSGGEIIVRQNTFRWSGTVSGASTNSTWTKSGAGTLRLDTSTYANGSYNGNIQVAEGTLALSGAAPLGSLVSIDVATGATFNLMGSQTIGSVAGGGSIVLGGNTLTTGVNNFSTELNGLISGTGNLTKTGSGSLALSRPVGNSYTGVTTITAGTLLAMNTTGSATGTGTVTVNAGAVLGGNGTSQGNVVNNGTVAPGGSIGTLHLGGNYTQGVGGKLEIELASTANHDELAVASTASLAGTLAVSLIGGFMPQAGDVFELMSASGFGGSKFTNSILPALAGGLGWNVNYNTNSVTLSVAIPGDFDGSGTVDAADYVLWRKRLGTTYSPADYDLWRVNFGRSQGAAGSNFAAVPEPSTLLLVLITALALPVVDAAQKRSECSRLHVSLRKIGRG